MVVPLLLFIVRGTGVISKMQFYDPHPGIGGAIVSLPEHLRIVANYLDGKDLPLEESQQLIQEAIDDIGCHDCAKIEFFNDCVLVKITENGATHCWRLVRIREEKNGSN